MAQLTQLSEGIEWFHRHTLKRVEELIMSEVPRALFFANDHDETAERNAERIAKGIANHHSA